MARKTTKTKILSPNTKGVTEILPLPEPDEARLKLHESAFPTARSSKHGASRKEIRSVTHRTMGSRQSNRKTERSGQTRQPKRGHGSQRKK